MDLSVIIVSWNTRELLSGCLRSVHEAAGGPTSEVFVVDNASTDGSVKMIRQHFPWVRLIANSENVGFAPATNQAIRQSLGRYILLLNSDAEVHSGALETMVQFMEEHPHAGGCGPLLLNADGSFQTSCYPMLTPEREFWRLVFLERLWRRATYGQECWDRETPRAVDAIKGACFLLRSAALAEVGLLDEQYFMYTEEFDLCYRLLQAGWQLWWVPRAIVTHHGEASAKQMAEQMYVQLHRSKVQFYRKFGGSHRANRFKGELWLAYVPRLAFATLTGSFSPSLRTRAQVFRHLLSEVRGM
jgi:GT2 family glycosyltransferase